MNMASIVTKFGLFLMYLSIIGIILSLSVDAIGTTDQPETTPFSEMTSDMSEETTPPDEITITADTTTDTTTEDINSTTATNTTTNTTTIITTTTGMPSKTHDLNTTSQPTTTVMPSKTPDLNTTSQPTTTVMPTELLTTFETQASTEVITTTELAEATTKGTTKSTTIVLPTTPLIGPVPEPEYPDLGDDATKVVAIEIKVLDENGDCSFSILQGCEDFERDFVQQVELSYKKITGFDNVDIVAIINTTLSTEEGPNTFATNVIVQHNVSYNWNQMDTSDRGLSANEIFEMTVGPDIAEGNIGNLTVVECPECNPPEEKTDLCGDAAETLCSEYFNLVCLSGIPTCRSQCLNVEEPYCKNGICTHSDPTSKPSCGCLHDPETFYFGEFCELQMNKLWFIIGVSVGGFVVVLLIAILSVCLVISRRAKQTKGSEDENSTHAEEELGMQNYGFSTNEVYDPSQPNEVVFQSRQDRPYSYIYSNGKDPALKTFGNAIAEEAARKQAEKHKNTAFWGNLNGEGAGDNEMQPILTHIDTSQGYRIQPRPKSVSSSIPEPDYDA